MIDTKTIKPKVGLGNLQFGMTRQDVSALIGEPNEIDQYSFTGEESDQSESWHYDDLDLSMSFDAEDDWRLTTLAISSDQYQLEGRSLVGENKADLISRLESLGWDDLVEDNDLLENSDQQLLSAEKHFVNFWFDEGKVLEVQWSAPFDEDDNISWPE